MIREIGKAVFNVNFSCSPGWLAAFILLLLVPMCKVFLKFLHNSGRVIVLLCCDSEQGSKDDLRPISKHLTNWLN